jgi:hypothetical protein
MCVFFENVGFVLLRRVLRAADDEFVMAPRVEVLGESHKAFEVFVFVARYLQLVTGSVGTAVAEGNFGTLQLFNQSAWHCTVKNAFSFKVVNKAVI